jgi:three-Cys-motif partner protein
MNEKQLTFSGIDHLIRKRRAKAKTENHYVWSPGEQPPILSKHSIAKHKILKAYLEKYVKILTVNLAQEHLKLTLVDGFAGGGVYLHPDTKERVTGSPLIMLNAMSAAEAAANESRKKQFVLDVEYFFVEKLPPTIEFLRNELHESKEARDQQERISILPGCFSDYLDVILRRVEQRGRSRRVIFVLDQYGFSDVRISDLRTIFNRLPNAEVILTVAIDWLIDHWTESERYDKILANLGLNVESALIDLVKEANPSDWRPVIQHTLHDQFYRNSGAVHYTPFFIHSVEPHRAYWLLHFFGHSKARDVMTQLHWELENHFQHFGQPGFCMLGYDPRRDFEELGHRMLTFGFDSFAAEDTRLALLEELPRRIALEKDPISFRSFFKRVVNETPATKEMLGNVISTLTLEKELEVRTSEGKLRQNGVRIHDDDVIVRPRQRLLLPPNS